MDASRRQEVILSSRKKYVSCEIDSSLSSSLSKYCKSIQAEIVTHKQNFKLSLSLLQRHFSGLANCFPCPESVEKVKRNFESERNQ